MIQYTKEEVKKLYDMIDVFDDNVNNLTAEYRIVTHKLSTSFSDQLTPEQSLERAFRFIARPFNRFGYKKVACKLPLEDMPLYINEPNKKSIIAKWRLSINK